MEFLLGTDAGFSQSLGRPISRASILQRGRIGLVSGRSSLMEAPQHRDRGRFESQDALCRKEPSRPRIAIFVVRFSVRRGGRRSAGSGREGFRGKLRWAHFGECRLALDREAASIRG